MNTDNPPKTFTEYNPKVDLSEKVVTRDKVYSILSKAIFRGDLKPEQRLVESKLAKLMKVSRTPIREAIIELLQKGLVVPSPPKGVKVAPLPTMNDLTEFYDIRGVLRGLAIRKAIKNITMREITRLEENIKKMEGLLLKKSIRSIANLNIEFHKIIEECKVYRKPGSQLDPTKKCSLTFWWFIPGHSQSHTLRIKNCEYTSYVYMTQHP